MSITAENENDIDPVLPDESQEIPPFMEAGIDPATLTSALAPGEKDPGPRAAIYRTGAVVIQKPEASAPAPRIHGVDMTSDPGSGALKGMGAKFFATYSSRSSWKVISPSQVTSLHADGLEVVFVFEDSATNAEFGLDQGVSDAEFAKKQVAHLCGSLKPGAIHFAVDYDSSANPAATDPYFDGVARVLGKENSGPYGGVAVIDHQASRGFKALWQTAAWSGGRLSPHARIYQYGFYNTYDADLALVEDYGQIDYQPKPKPKPAPKLAVSHPGYFIDGRFLDGKQVRNERVIVEAFIHQYNESIERHHASLLSLQAELAWLRRRVWAVAHHWPVKVHGAERPSWGVAHRGYRWQELARLSKIKL